MKLPAFASLAALALFTAACGDKTGSTVDVPWGPEGDGVRVRLVPLADSFAVGKPMPFRIEMQNVSSGNVGYDRQGVGVNDSFEVTGSGGEPVGYIGGSVQTVGGEMLLGSGETVVLAEHVDLSRDYLITEPGKYRVRFRGGRAAFGEVSFPVSNTIEMKVGRGKVSLAETLAAKLLPILPDERWEASVYDGGISLICNRTGLKADLLVLSIGLAGKGEEAGGEVLGSRSGKRITLANESDEAEVEEAWPGFRDKIAAALEFQR